MAAPPCPPSPSSSTCSKFGTLPIMAMKHKIVEKIMENRVTLIVGETGCGKSSQVPMFLREANMTPVVCTQPRRFAVVAVANMVAKAVDCEIGEEVGYHIGHSKVLSASSKIVFKTAGVLLEEMRDKGMNALKYKAIILDEVHERSVESDLVLVCVKQFLLKNKDIRLVLMSATADISRYRDYFKDLDRDERVEVLAIPTLDQHTNFQRKVLYLEQVADLVEESAESLDSLSLKYCSGMAPSMAKAEIKLDVHKLIHELVLYIHKTEPDIEKSILIFLPTYYSLEQQWVLLKPFSSCFKVHILHSSVDTEKALMAMKILKSHRKVILATNIAESSVTIPGVAHVIDSCRSLQVYWDVNRKRDVADLVWVSKSQADQRRGRTGRTCDGQIYRLVTGSFYDKLPSFESPAILKLSLRLQVLMICCAESKLINDPRVLSQKALDAPDLEIIEDALNLLVEMKALKKAHPRGRFEPTFYGRLLTSFSLSFDASVLILKFADAGMLHEGILLGILTDTQPQPIVRPFGQESLFMAYTDSYYTMEGENPCLTGKKEVVFVANLCAYQFWQCVCKDKLRLEHLKQLLRVDEMRAPQSYLSKIEEDWCSCHNLLQSSMTQISEIYNDILCSLHRYRPKFLAISSGLPSYYDTGDFQHTCLLECQPSHDAVALLEEDELNVSSKCVAVPYVSSHHFRVQRVAEKFANVIKEIRVQHPEDLIEDTNQLTYMGPRFNGDMPMCVYYVKGFCSRGNVCPFSHSLQAKRPACKFFASFQGCRNGDSCSFSHDLGPQVVSTKSSLCVPEEEAADATALVELFPASSNGFLLLLDDTDLHFSMSFSQHYEPSKIISTTCLSETTIYDASLSGVRTLWGVHQPLEIFTSEAVKNSIPWGQVKCIFWFPDFDDDDSTERQKRLIQNFFEHLAAFMSAGTFFDTHVILVMNNIRFSHLQVEKLGREYFYFLTNSFPFDESSFGALSDDINTKKPLILSRAVSYVFTLRPPLDLQFRDFVASFHDRLRIN